MKKKSSSPNKKKVVIVLSPNIGEIDKKHMAGTERMFFKDILALKTQFLITAFARFGNKSPAVKKILFFTILSKISLYLEKKLRLFNLAKFVSLIANLFYLFQMNLNNFHSDIWFGYSFPVLCLLNKKHTVILLQSYEEFLFPELLSRYYQKANYVFVSEFLKDFYLNKYDFIDKKKTYVLRNATNRTKFRYIPHKTTSKMRLLYCSAWENEKGLDLLLKANMLLSEKARKKVEISIASNSHLWFHEKFNSNQLYVEKINKLLRSPLNSNVKLLNGISYDKMPKIYNAHDFLIFPSTWGEPCSLSLIESISCGLPVIAFNVGGNCEIISESNSILPQNISAASLAESICEVIRGKKKLFKNASLFGPKNVAMNDGMRNSLLLNYLNLLITS